ESRPFSDLVSTTMKGPLARFGSLTDFQRREQVSCLRCPHQQHDRPLASRGGEVVHDLFGKPPAPLGAGCGQRVQERIDAASQMRGPLSGAARLDPRRQRKVRDLGPLLQPPHEVSEDRVSYDWIGHGTKLRPTLAQSGQFCQRIGLENYFCWCAVE